MNKFNDFVFNIYKKVDNKGKVSLSDAKTVGEMNELIKNQQRELEDSKEKVEYYKSLHQNEYDARQKSNDKIKQQLQEIELLNSQELLLNRSIETKDLDHEVEENQEAVCIAGKWKGYRAFWDYKGNGVYNFRYKSPSDDILHWLYDDGEYEDDSDWRIVADVIPNPIK